MGLGVCETCGVDEGHNQNCKKTSVSAVAFSDVLSWLQQIEMEQKKEPSIFGITMHINPEGKGSIANIKWLGTHDENTFIKFNSIEELSRLIKKTR